MCEFWGPDGDVIDVFAKRSNGSITFTDLCESLWWLRMQTPSPKRSPRQRQLIADACLTHDADLYKGMLVARARSPRALRPRSRR